MSLRVSQLSLFGLTLLGAQALHGFGNANGFWAGVEKSSQARLFPDSNVKCPTNFTGIKALDEVLLTFLMFFWRTVDGSKPDLSLACFLFVGQCVPILTVAFIEGARNGNKGRLVSYIVVYTFFVQTVGFAVLAPAYLLIHLLTSPTVTSTPLATALSLDEGFLTGIPFGLLLGFVAPTVFMSVSAPTYLSIEHKVQAILIWQLSPIYAITLAYIWKFAFWQRIKYILGLSTQQDERRSLRLVYMTGLMCGAMVHIATITLSITAYFIPTIFAEGIAEEFQLTRFLSPPNPFSDTQASSIAQGALWFIQWDYLIASTAYLIWSLTLRSLQRRQAFNMTLLLDVVARIVVIGPMAAALTFMWQRDEEAFTTVNMVAAKKSR